MRRGRRSADEAAWALDLFFTVVAVVCMLLCFFASWLSFSANIRDNAREFGILRAIGLNVSQVRLRNPAAARTRTAARCAHAPLPAGAAMLPVRGAGGGVHRVPARQHHWCAQLCTAALVRRDAAAPAHACTARQASWWPSPSPCS